MVELPTTGPEKLGMMRGKKISPAPWEFQPQTLWTNNGNVVSKAESKTAATQVPYTAVINRLDFNRMTIGRTRFLGEATGVRLFESG